MSEVITLDDIVAARKRIAAHIQPLRVTRSDSLSTRFGSEIMLAHEYLQTTGAFKLRGAMNSVLQLPCDASGVTAVSTGNHGRALAYSARQAGRGLGLGLSKCWRIVVTNHGGQIDVESQPGHGSLFVITLPRKRK